MTIELSAGDLRLVLDPETGGAIAAFTHRGTALLRPVADARLRAQHGRAVAGYPLIPFANRLGFGRFSFGGQAFALAPNFGDEPHTIHGNAWMHAWTLIEAGPQSASLALDFEPQGGLAAEWPFAYRAEQSFELAANALRVTLRLHNTDERPAPAGLGLHPLRGARGRQHPALRGGQFSGRRTRTGCRRTARPPMEAGSSTTAHVLTQAVIDTCYAGWGRRGGAEPAGKQADPDAGVRAAAGPFATLHAGWPGLYRARTGQQHAGRGEPDGRGVG